MLKDNNNNNNNNNKIGYLYFYIHLITEIICFYSLSKVIGNSYFLWIIPLFYDMLAFVPQGLIGYINDKFLKINMGLIGMILMIIGLFVFKLNIIIGIIIIAIGNAFVHVRGAEITLRTSNGRMSPSAIFVAGGSFGVILGKLLGKNNYSLYFILFLALSSIPFILLAETYKLDKKLTKFNYSNNKLNPMLIILITTLIVSVRGYVGYGLPTAWNKTTLQTVYLFFIMGLGKALGGILIDKIGIKKTAYLSILGSIPFLLIGNNYMLISLFGVMFYSMTMAITLAILVSVLKEKPGLAFGFTTIGLFLGTVPVFFIKIVSNITNTIIICALSLFVLILAMIVIKEDKDEISL